MNADQARLLAEEFYKKAVEKIPDYVNFGVNYILKQIENEANKGRLETQIKYYNFMPDVPSQVRTNVYMKIVSIIDGELKYHAFNRKNDLDILTVNWGKKK